LPGGGRLDAATRKRAIEIERSGDPKLLVKAVRRLEKSGLPQRELKMPQSHMETAIEAMKVVGVGGTVSNIGGTKTRRVLRPRKP
jgi:hypothetical protein